MKIFFHIAALSIAALGLTACVDDDTNLMPTHTSYYGSSSADQSYYGRGDRQVTPREHYSETTTPGVPAPVPAAPAGNGFYSSKSASQAPGAQSDEYYSSQSGKAKRPAQGEGFYSSNTPTEPSTSTFYSSH